MKLKTILPDTITAGLNLADTIAKIGLGLLPSSEERLLRIKLRQTQILARSAKNATKAEKQALKLKLQAIKKGIRVAKVFKRLLDKLNSDLDAVLEKLGD